MRALFVILWAVGVIGAATALFAIRSAFAVMTYAYFVYGLIGLAASAIALIVAVVGCLRELRESLFLRVYAIISILICGYSALSLDPLHVLRSGHQLAKVDPAQIAASQWIEWGLAPTFRE